MWKEKLKKIMQEEALYGEQINSGATEKQLELFKNKVNAELKTNLPDEYCKILEVVNGLEFNGFILYGIDQNLIEAHQNQKINGLIENNRIWYENKWQKRYVFLGESNISWYVYDLTAKNYCELDNPSGNQVEVFNNIETMIEKVLTDAYSLR